jgi:hypothetical protein
MPVRRGLEPGGAPVRAFKQREVEKMLQKPLILVAILAVLIFGLMPARSEVKACDYQNAGWYWEWCFTWCGTDFIFMMDCFPTYALNNCYQSGFGGGYCGQRYQPFDCWEYWDFMLYSTSPCPEV